VIAIIKMSGNRLVSNIANNSARRCSPNLVLKHLPVSPNVKHATSAARDAVDEMGGGAREMVLVTLFIDQ
jgi:hypothetical protein